MTMQAATASSFSFLTGGNAALDEALAGSAEALVSLQKEDGHWCFELEADATIPAEFVLLDHFFGEIRQDLHERMGAYLRSIQEEHGGWSLFHRGAFDMSASVKAYFALKCIGDDIYAPHMMRARKAILAHGGAEHANVFTRIQMALFGAVPWKAAPVMPVEIMILPKWFPFHLHKIAYWSRTVIVPLLVLCAKKPMAKNPRGITLDELFITPPHQVKNWHSNPNGSWFVPVFRVVDAVLRAAEPFFPKGLRQRSIDKAVAWTTERLNGIDGLGAIYPAMANAAMMYNTVGRPLDDPDFVTARKSIDNMVVDLPERTYCQPCLSPVWDTALSTHAVLEAGLDKSIAVRSAEWLAGKQVLDVVGDWAFWRPNVRPGGWAFQYNNAYYPDLDDTAVVVMALDRLDHDKYRETINRAVEWVLGLQSKNGGWGAFDADNTYYYLNYIPFADHGALLDPPSADVSARCLSMLAQLGYKKDQPNVAAAIEYLRREQEKEGCWFGRWGTNYIYGTWSVLCALNAIGMDHQDPMIRRAVQWLISVQQEDGGWGESGASYYPKAPKGQGIPSTPTQTSWALLALMAAGEVDHDAVRKGVQHLMDSRNEEGTWTEEHCTAVGFPRVFYLSYRGYKLFFPLWALSRYKNLKQGNSAQVLYGM
ncbi:MAG: squalene--hopene cyclase [Bdellovibrionales bacterium]